MLGCDDQGVMDRGTTGTTPAAATALLLGLLLLPILTACGGGSEEPTGPDTGEDVLSFEPIAGTWAGSGTYGEDDTPFTITELEIGSEAAVGHSIGSMSWHDSQTSCEGQLIALDVDGSTYTVLTSSVECSTEGGGRLDEGLEVLLDHLPDLGQIQFETNISSGTLQRA